MQALRIKKVALAIASLVVTIFLFTITLSHKPVDFSRQVKPIINKHCIACHGGVKAKNNFSLLFRDEALANTKSGKPAIIPGDPDGSEMIRRLTLNDPEERMPYQHDPLAEEEIQILRKWIKEGAHWGEHWAYVPVKDVPVPQPEIFFGLLAIDSDWAKNSVDNFIEKKLNELDVKPSPEADKRTLLRRVSLDIIGMPPPDSIAQAFLNDSSDTAYQQLVDNLLASPHYGERWTSVWLDVARYADTKGYEADMGRNIWKYRDWLIRAFNEDKPYNQFVTEQLAGDLMPEATDEHYIATGFHRNTMTNDEGGTDNEEFRTAAVLDRVNTTWEGLMGTTFACVQCHSHPYDPFKHEEYYKFMAFFNNTRDEDTTPDYPLLRHFDDTLQQKLSTVVSWIEQNTSPKKANEAQTFLKTWQPSYNSLLCDSFINSEITGSQFVLFRNQAICRLKDVALNNKNRLIFRYKGLARGGVWKIHVDNPKGEVIATFRFPGVKNEEWKIVETSLKPVKGAHHLYFTYTNDNLKKPTDAGVIIEWLHLTEELAAKDKEGYAAMKKEYWNLLTASVPTTPVMMDNPADMHRPTYVFERGNWLVKGDKVELDVPQSLNPFPANAPRNRLGLAMWITSRQNPLTARTMVNRVWEQLFGTGLAETLEDLGSQGISPTHPELLDWLSYQFMNKDNWSVKKLIRTVVMSATYRQHSKVTPELLEKDPYNKFYARGARFRLSSEQIRDQALCISGLMSTKMFGPSVMPWQPKGIWQSPWSGQNWYKSQGEEQHRRALYTYWKRTAAYPSMIAFDATSHEVTTARRIRTNTPLQALTTLNDSAYFDMARHFAYRIKQKAGTDIAQQIKTGFEMATYHDIDTTSLQALLKLYDKAFNTFKNDAERTCEIIGVMNEHNNAETAALVVVANALLNLDEVVTKN